MGRWGAFEKQDWKSTWMNDFTYLICLSLLLSGLHICDLGILHLIEYLGYVKVATDKNKPKMANSRDFPKMAVWHYGLKLQ